MTVGVLIGAYFYFIFFALRLRRHPCHDLHRFRVPHDIPQEVLLQRARLQLVAGCTSNTMGAALPVLLPHERQRHSGHQEISSG